jgi:hypothetical protein
MVVFGIYRLILGILFDISIELRHCALVSYIALFCLPSQRHGFLASKEHL